MGVVIAILKTCFSEKFIVRMARSGIVARPDKQHNCAAVFTVNIPEVLMSSEICMELKEIFISKPSVELLMKMIISVSMHVVVK